jgi:hypothetical protein
VVGDMLKLSILKVSILILGKYYEFLGNFL